MTRFHLTHVGPYAGLPLCGGPKTAQDQHPSYSAAGLARQLANCCTACRAEWDAAAEDCCPTCGGAECGGRGCQSDHEVPCAGAGCGICFEATAEGLF